MDSLLDSDHWWVCSAHTAKWDNV